MKRSSKLGILIILTITVAAGIYWLRSSPFRSACLERLQTKKYEKNLRVDLCGTLERSFFKSRQPIQEISPETVQAPALPIDRQVRFVTFYDPAHLAGFGYCYFVFRGWFNPKDLSPKQLALAASGFAILKSELTGYPEWLKTEKGLECAKSLSDSVKLAPRDLEKEMADKVSIIAFNPVGAIRSDDGLDAVLKEALLTINHERIHAIHVTCPDVDKAASKHWNTLSASDKKKLKEGHLNYDWSNKTVAVREAFAYLLEDHPEAVLKHMGNCSL